MLPYIIHYNNDIHEIPDDITTVIVNCLIDLTEVLKYCPQRMEKFIVVNYTNDNTRYETMDFNRFASLEVISLGDVLVNNLYINHTHHKDVHMEHIIVNDLYNVK